MSPNNISLLSVITSLSNHQIQQAGQRYTPGIDPQAPNLRIETLFTAIENIACGSGAMIRFQSILDSFFEAWNHAKHCSQNSNFIITHATDAQSFLPELMLRLRECDAGAAHEWFEKISNLESRLSDDMTYWEGKAKLLPNERGQAYSSEQNTIRGNMNSISQCLTILRNELAYTKSPAFKGLFDPQLLISGEWGTGKTHLLCDFSQDRISRGQPNILLLAKNFEGDVVSEICARIEVGRSENEIFDRLEDLAGETKERLVIIIDGVNEGRGREWREAITKLQSLIAARAGLGLIVTCRTPFEAIAIEQKALNSLHKVTHFGFDDQEFDAQASFFDYYKLALPEVPLLDREFSRPLTLNLICKSLQNLTEKKLAQRFSGIASGQKGMTYILEFFVNSVGRQIERECGLKSKGCWELLKGGDLITDQRLAGVAPCMAVNLRGYVRRTEIDRIIHANYPGMKPIKRRQLLDLLRTSGLLEEDVVWYSKNSRSTSRIVYRLPYQRFSDHLIARHLLTTYLDTSSVKAIKESFSAKSPLANIFRTSNRQFLEPGWAQALITEFPTRIGSRLPPDKNEIFFVLPKKCQSLNAYFNPFIEGFFWRDPGAFTEATRILVNQYLNSGSMTWERMVDTLAAVSTKPRHPYHARRLYDFLANLSMSERDLRWSEFLRRNYASPTIGRLLTWAEKLSSANMTEDSAAELVVLFSLVLTTVMRRDRDLATKALVLIGERFPEVLFTHVITSLGFNDPYVPERMLASAYGVTLSLVDSAIAQSFRPLLGSLARTLYKEMFGREARYATHHTLMRDYALGIIELAQRAKCISLTRTQQHDVVAPFSNIPSKFKGDGTENLLIKDAIGNAIQMDFGNYTIGRLIPNRGNYDNKNPDYLRVRSKIEQRIFDLGYRAELFKEVDAEIANRSWNSSDHHRMDRYGKKYSWIAFFEMWGERDVTSQLPDWYLGERTSDCGVDPSFPKHPPDWAPPIPELFGGRIDASAEAWVEGGFTPNWNSLLVVPKINENTGDWILLEGFVRGVDESLDREIFGFLRGVFVEREDIDKLRAKFLAVDYPGNNKIPEGITEHYLYAGEAGRRKNFASSLCKHDGQYDRQLSEALDQYVPITSASKKSLNHKSKMRHVPGVSLEIPFIHFGWESYHSAQNTYSDFNLPAPSLIQNLGLASKNREIDFYDSTGRPGTLYRESGNGWKGDRHSLLYVRADLLRNYLAATKQVLVWCNWGERDWAHKMDGHNRIHESSRQRIYEAHGHIHRIFLLWSDDGSISS